MAIDKLTTTSFLDESVTNLKIAVSARASSVMASASVGDLSDVDITTSAPTNNQSLIWDNANSKFIPGNSFSQGDFDTALTASNTDDLSEGTTNLYYTDARADARVALVIDSAPGALNTLNELAAALGDDANFSTTVTNSIATKLPLSGGTMTGNIDGNGNKVLFANVYSALGDLPSASTYHGMFAHVHSTGKGYFAHAGSWIALANDADKLNLSGGTMSGDIDGNGNKVLFANVYSALGDLPSASTYHGMFAHVHGTGKGYFAHAGSWVALANDADKLNLSGGTMTGDLTVPNLITSGNVDGRDVSADGLKLDGIESNAKDDQTITAGTGLTGGGTGDVTLSHADTSSQVSSNNSGRTYIQDITLDTYGHITSLATATETVTNTNLTHTGEVTGSTSLTISDNVVDEANLKVSNSPTDGYFLSAQSGNTGGLTWATVPAGYTDSDVASYLSANDYDTSTNIIAAITDSAPGTLDTLNELAAALGDDASFSTTVTNSIATKLPLAGGTLTGNLSIDGNGTKNLQIGHNRTDSGYAHIDLVGDTTYSDYGLRLLRGNGGANTTSQILHRGTGNLEISALDSSAIRHNIAGSEKLKTNSVGITVSGNVTVSGTVDGRDVATDGLKLDGISSSANNYTHPNHTGEVTSTGDGATVIVDNVVDAGNLKVTGNGTTTQFLRSDGDGTFTWATPVDTNTVYTHPTHTGDDISIDTGALTGATVISDLDFNITTDTLGHVTDANGTIATRTLTLANLGYTGETNATADQTASEILTLVKTVDGTGSGLDADLLDGNHSSAFATSAQGTKADNALPKSGGTMTGDLLAPGVNIGTTNTSYDLYNNGTSYLNGSATVDDNLLVTGNLTVQGIVTTTSAATLDVEDKTITLNFGSGDTTATADGSGIIIQDAVNSSTNASILWDTATDTFEISNNIDVTGNIAVSGTVDGVDIAARDSILTSTTTTANAALPKAGGTMTGTLSLNGNQINTANMTGSNTKFPGHAYSNTHDGSNVYWHIGEASGSTNKRLNLRIYKSDNSYLVNTWGVSGLSLSGNLSLSGTVDGRDVATDGTKLDTIATGATANVGDITGVTAGTGLSGGGTSGSVTVNLSATTSPIVATELTNAIDLNNLNAAQAGFYYQQSNADTSGNNYPNGHAGSLIVQKSAGNATQLYQTYSGSPELFFRSNYTSGYSAWRKIWHEYNDGSGSGLDADTVDGIQASSFLRSDADDTMTGNLTIDSSAAWNSGNGMLNVGGTGDGRLQVRHIWGKASSAAGPDHIWLNYQNNSKHVQIGTSGGGNNLYVANEIYAGGYFGGNLVWNAGNDGSGSGLDADLLDGQQGSYYMPASTTTISVSNSVSGSAFATTTSPGSVLEYQQAASITDTKLAPSGDWYNSIRMGHGNPYSYYSNTIAVKMTGTGVGTLYTQTISNNSAQGWNKHWHDNNDGSGSGLDADLLDGQHGSYYQKKTTVQDAAPSGATGDLWYESDSGSFYVYYGGAWVDVAPGVETNTNLQINSLGVGTAASGTSGEIRATNDVTAYYSDERLKDFHGNIDSALDKVNQLNGYYFTENETAKELGYDNNKRQVGVSAQEVEAVLPEVVAEAPISDEYLTVKYEKLAPLFIEAIKEIDKKYQDKIDMLMEEIEKLKGN